MRSRVTPAILVADDEPAIRTSLARFMAHAGYGVCTAQTVDETLEAVKGGGLSAVILDMLFGNRGGRTGLDVLLWMRRAPRFTNLPVLVLTGYPIADHLVQQFGGCRRRCCSSPSPSARSSVSWTGWSAAHVADRPNGPGTGSQASPAPEVKLS